MTIRQLRSTAPAGRLWICLWLIALLAAGSARAQQSSADAVDDPQFRELIRSLRLMQLREIEAAQDAVELHVEAARILRGLDPQLLGGPAVAAAVRTLADNSLALAVVLLSPIGTKTYTAWAAYDGLLERTLADLEAVLASLEGQGVARDALARVRSDLLAARQLTSTFESDWATYGEALRQAELAGIIPGGTFDPANRSWRLSPSPDLGTANDGERAAEVGTAILPSANAGGGANQDAVTTSSGGGVPTGWTVGASDAGFPAASAMNLNAESSAKLSSLTIACNVDGTLRYEIAGGHEFSELSITYGEDQRAFVAVENGTVVGTQALRLSDSLRLAHEWASKSGEQRIIITSVDDPTIVAALPTASYYEARGRVLDACQPHDAPVEESNGRATPGAIAPIPYPRPVNR
jgi:hypothetical protein